MNSKKLIPIIVFFVCSVILVVNISLTIMSMGIIVNDPAIEILESHGYLITAYLIVYLILAAISIFALWIYQEDEILNWKLNSIVDHTAETIDKVRVIEKLLKK